MPGMMDTILNVGLNDDAVRGLAHATGNSAFAYDCYRRLIQMFGETVDGIEPGHFKDDPTNPERTVETFKNIYRRETGEDFPQDAREQLRRAVVAVFESWNTPRANVYRQTYGIPHDIGTAVNVVQMVFGNKGEALGDRCVLHAQPVDGRAGRVRRVPRQRAGRGRRRRHPHAAARSRRWRQRLPEAYAQLLETMARLEQHYRDMQDIEFTVEEGHLYLLQTRSAKRTAAAALKAAVDMTARGADQPRGGDRADRSERSSTSCCIRCSTRRRSSRSQRAG